MDGLLHGFTDEERALLQRSPKQLDASIRAEFGRQRIAMAALVLWSASLIAATLPGFRQAHPVLFVAILLVPAARLLWPLLSVFSAGTPLSEANPEDLGEMSSETAEALASHVASRMGGWERPRMFVVKDKHANAMAINSMFFNFIPALNSIRLHSYLFRAMSREELGAVLSHELAHFHRYMGPLMRNRWLAVLLSIASLLTAFTLLPWLGQGGLWVYFTFLWAPTPFLLLLGLLSKGDARDLEFASDAVAAEVMGPLAMINALLKLGDRNEVFELVEDAVAARLQEDPEADVGKVAEELLARIPEGPVTVEQARGLLQTGGSVYPRASDEAPAKGFLEAASHNRRLRAELAATPWRCFDAIVADHRLDAQELGAFLRHLAAGENPATHRVVSEHPETEPAMDHPSMRKRVTYLYLHYVHGGGVAGSERILG